MTDGPGRLEALAATAGRGERTAFAALARAIAPRLHRLAWGILGDGDQADDAVQETLIKLAEALPGYDPSRPFWPWARRIGTRTALDLRRRERRRPTVALDAAGDAPARDADRPDRRLEAAAGRALLERLLAALPEMQRTVVSLRDLAGVPAVEIAAALDLSASTVRVHLTRARRRLRELLATDLAEEVEP